MLERRLPPLKDPDTGVVTIFPREKFRDRLRAIQEEPFEMRPVMAQTTANPAPAVKYRVQIPKPLPLSEQGSATGPYVDPNGPWTASFTEPIMLPPGSRQLVPAYKPLENVRASGATGIQLLAIGPEDRYLTIYPSYSHFRRTHKTHTPFAIMTDETMWTSGFVPGRTATAPIGLRGDIAIGGMLEISLPALPPGSSWIPNVGLAIVKTWRLFIGETLVQTIPRDWLFYNKITRTKAEKTRGFNAMIGGESGGGVIYVPLPFFFSHRHPLPVIALSNASNDSAPAKIEVDVENWSNLIVGSPSVKMPGEIQCTLLMDYCLLGDEERASFMGFGHRILFKTIATTDAPAYAFDSSTGRANPRAAVTVPLSSINLPIAQLVVIARDEDDATNKSMFTYRSIGEIEMFLSSQKRFETRPGAYFGECQFYDHELCIPSSSSNVYVYSFTLPGSSATDNAGHVDLSTAFTNPTLRVSGVSRAASPPARVVVMAEVHSFLTCENGFARIDRVG